MGLLPPAGVGSFLLTFSLTTIATISASKWMSPYDPSYVTGLYGSFSSGTHFALTLMGWGITFLKDVSGAPLVSLSFAVPVAVYGHSCF